MLSSEAEGYVSVGAEKANDLFRGLNGNDELEGERLTVVSERNQIGGLLAKRHSASVAANRCDGRALNLKEDAVKRRTGIVYRSSESGFCEYLCKLALIHGKTSVACDLGKVGVIAAGMSLKLKHRASANDTCAAVFTVYLNSYVAGGHSTDDLEKAGCVEKEKAFLFYVAGEVCFDTLFKVVAYKQAGTVGLGLQKNAVEGGNSISAGRNGTNGCSSGNKLIAVDGNLHKTGLSLNVFFNI